ncbi:nicastrin isoform X2 [Daktulosphaira vitifoliae]|uniref:nicastrin isoform X2 n=1 Tax=Daktulosphaira vitifoliae TaxID=58002 RepID=UPI0021AA1C42|nr:nicastrin isoform X2 [Daktulosphaira vitifoliae]
MYIDTLKKIELSDQKINGVLLLINGTYDKVIANDKLQMMGFSPEDICPNRVSSSTHCPSTLPWNPFGSGILLEGWDFPIFVINDIETIKEIQNCFQNYNLPSKDQSGGSLCSLELKSHMYAAVDSKTCMRRTLLSYQNIRPIKFCDPLGDKNIHWTLKEFEPNVLNNSLAVIAVRLDATSMFQGLAPGALSTATSIVTLLATAKFISEILPYNISKNYSKNVMFILFNGEAYDYIGSSRVLYDMSKNEFPNDLIKLQMHHIDLYIELSQLHYDKEIVFHRLTKYNASDSIYNFMDDFENVLSSKGFKVLKSGNSAIPPASIHSFLKVNPQFPGLVLAGYRDQYKNLFYHSIMDDSDNINYSNAEISNTLANISESLGTYLYKFVTNTTYNGNAHVHSEYIKELLYCYTKSINCTEFQSLTSPISLADTPPNYYISVDLFTNPITSLTRLLLSSFGSLKIDNVFNEEDCNTYTSKQGFSSIWLRGKYNACYLTTSNYSEAVSPAFIISDYDLSSHEFSTWTESVWHEVQIRMFLKQSFQMQIVILVLGISIFLISFIIIHRVNSQSDSYFYYQESSSVTSC